MSTSRLRPVNVSSNDAATIAPPRPPKKLQGQALGRRGFRDVGGELLDVFAAARMLGWSEKMLRARVIRRTVPFRRLGSRLVFRRRDLEAFTAALDGCGFEEALANMAAWDQA